MVMTRSDKPGLSFGGTMLVLTLIACGWVVGPVLACPKADKAKEKRAAEAAAVELVTMPSPPEAADAPTPTTNEGDTFRSHLKQKLHAMHEAEDAKTAEMAEKIRRELMLVDGGRRAPQPDDGLARRMAELEAQIADVSAQIAQLRMLRAATAIEAPPEPSTEPRWNERATAPGARGLSGRVRSRSASPFPAQTKYWQKYHLAEGRLEALTELMVRSDVPIFVRPGSRYIEVQGTELEHAAFGDFVQMIGDEMEKEWRPYAVSSGKLELLNELMVRNDVPIYVRPGKETIEVQGNSREQAVFEAFLRIIGENSTSTSKSKPKKMKKNRVSSNVQWQAPHGQVAGVHQHVHDAHHEHEHEHDDHHGHNHDSDDDDDVQIRQHLGGRTDAGDASSEGDRMATLTKMARALYDAGSQVIADKAAHGMTADETDASQLYLNASQP